MRTMANPDDPVTHEELAELLSEKLDPIISLVSNLPGAAKVDPPPDDDDDSDDTPRFSLREMESYAERQVKKAVRDLVGKSPKEKPAPKVKDDDGPKDDDKPEPPPPTPEPPPDPTPGKKSKSEKWWGK